MPSKLQLSVLMSNLTINNCLTNCSNNGVCRFANNSLVCECNLFFTGFECAIDLRPCSSWPCLYGSKCIQNLTDLSFYCNCSDLYYGKYCHNKVDVCKDVTCSGNGYCADVNDKPKCKCFYLYSGDLCEIVTDLFYLFF